MNNVNNIEQLPQIDWWYVLIAVFILLAFIKTAWSIIDWFLFKKFKIETKKMRQRREDKELLEATTALAKTTAENLDKLQKRHTKDEEEFRTNLNNYMQESQIDIQALHDEMAAYKNLNDAQDKIKDKVDDICNKLNEMEEKENKRVQSEIKERIAQSYREYNKTKQITSIELEALEDLITTYEEHGGENSFVHSKVQNEMYTWEVK